MKHEPKDECEEDRATWDRFITNLEHETYGTQCRV